MDGFKRIAWMAASVWLALAAGIALAQDEAADMLAAGNSAYRNGQFEAARDAYRGAIAAGHDSPILRYNLGIAHYRLGEYIEAELSLEQAASDPSLAPMANYNIGLASLAAGWPEAARSRFDEVLRISDDASLRQLAERAVARTRSREADARNTRPSRPDWRPYREPEPKVGELYFSVAARYGADDNVYRTPSSAYVDLAQTGQPLITPEIQSAGFMPVDLLAHYTIAAEEQSTDFTFAYRMSGDFYDSEFSNANQVTQRFEIGADVELQGKHARALQTTFFAVTHDETNFDPDTGIDRDVAGQDISNRFSYDGAGLHSSYSHLMERWAFGFDTRIERRSYEDAPIVTRYDHEFYDVELWVERELGASTELFFSLTNYRREYDVRRARDGTGVLSTANPTLEYSYTGAQIGAERRLGNALSVTAAYMRIDRADNFEGYADYSHDMLRLGLDYRPSRRMRIDVVARARIYDYPNAFAFNDPAGGALEIDSATAEIDFEYRFTDRVAVWTELLLRDESSTDPRLNYARNRAMLGIRWRL